MVKKAKIEEGSIGIETAKDLVEEGIEQGGHLSNIALFQPLPTELGVDKTVFIDYRPISTLSHGSVIEFSIPAQGMNYVDLSKSLLYIRAKIVNIDGTVLPAAAKVAWINIPMHSLFRQVELSLQEVVVTNGVNTNYAYKSIIDILTNFEEDVKETQFQSVLYSKDSRGHLDATDPVQGLNLGLKYRYQFTKGSITCDMLGPLYLDLAVQDRLMLNNVKIRLKLFPSQDSYSLMTSDKGKYKTVIEEAIFKVATITVSPKVIKSHDMALTVSPAEYYIKKSEIKPFSIGNGLSVWATDDLFSSRIPTKLTIGLVDSSAYTGDETKNPFNFQHFNLNFLSFEVNGCPYPAVPFKPNYTNGTYINAYMSLFSANGTVNTSHSNYIERLDYPQGYCLYSIPINLYRGDDFINKTQYGQTRLSIQFSKALAQPVTVICYAVFDDIIQIDRARNVKFKEPTTNTIDVK